jgi:chromosome segregation ATPase
MKKVFLLAFMALSLSVAAQKVTPLTIELAEVDINALRAQYQSEPIMYRAALDKLSKDLEGDAAEIKNAKAQLKVEQSHSKEMEKSLKEAEKMAASLKSLYTKEEAELKKMMQTVQKQQQTLSKQVELNEETRESYVAFLEKQQKELNYSLREVADRQRAISDLEATISNSKTNMQYYVQAVNQKAADLANIEAQHKQRVSTVKAEQKSAKSMQ